MVFLGFIYLFFFNFFFFNASIRHFVDKSIKNLDLLNYVWGFFVVCAFFHPLLNLMTSTLTMLGEEA